MQIKNIQRGPVFIGAALRLPPDPVCDLGATFRLMAAFRSSSAGSLAGPPALQEAAKHQHDIRGCHKPQGTMREVRYGEEYVYYCNNGKDQREEKDEPRWCAQVRHVDPLLDKVPDEDAYGDQDD